MIVIISAKIFDLRIIIFMYYEIKLPILLFFLIISDIILIL